MKLGLGRSIYTESQMREFYTFQNAAGARNAFLADQTKRAYSGMSDGEWGLSLRGTGQGDDDQPRGVVLHPAVPDLRPSVNAVHYADLRHGAPQVCDYSPGQDCRDHKGERLWGVGAGSRLGDPLPACHHAHQVGQRHSVKNGQRCGAEDGAGS